MFEKSIRDRYGAGNNLIAEMRLNSYNNHENFFRMGLQAFDSLLAMVGPAIQKIDSRREPIPTRTRLAITLRYLAAGDSMTGLTYLFRVGLSTISDIISETTVIIWKVLQPLVLMPPKENEWLQIAQGFEETWQFPNCIGAIDGKHVTIQAPPNSGSQFYNYKGNHSIVLLAVVDDKYSFTLVDIGAEGRRSDGSIFKSSQIGRRLESKCLNIPAPRCITEGRFPLPYVLVGDEAFPLGENLLRPYPGKGGLTVEKSIFNYSLFRARRISENAFGILTARWRIYSKPIIAKLDNIEITVKATICLHNYIIRHHNNPAYNMPNLVDREVVHGKIISGSWREQSSNLMPLGRLGANTYLNNVRHIRDSFKEYFNEKGAVPWQWNIV